MLLKVTAMGLYPQNQHCRCSKEETLWVENYPLSDGSGTTMTLATAEPDSIPWFMAASSAEADTAAGLKLPAPILPAFIFLTAAAESFCLKPFVLLMTWEISAAMSAPSLARPSRPPEQYRGEYGPASDIYSLGAT